MTTRANVKPRRDEGDICQIQNLCSMWQGQCPKLRCGSEDMYKAVSCARRDFGAIWQTDKVGVAVAAISTVELFPRGNDERLDGVSGLNTHRGVNHGEVGM